MCNNQPLPSRSCNQLLTCCAARRPKQNDQNVPKHTISIHLDATWVARQIVSPSVEEALYSDLHCMYAYYIDLEGGACLSRGCDCTLRMRNLRWARTHAYRGYHENLQASEECINIAKSFSCFLRLGYKCRYSICL